MPDPEVVSALEEWMRSIGLTDEPEKYSDGIHSWRCAYPDRYGRCDCFAETLASLVQLVEEGLSRS